MDTEIIIKIIMKGHKGKENAITRDKLRHVLDLVYYTDLPDRLLRRIVKTIPEICSSEHGYYISSSQSDYDDAIEYLKKKIYPLWTNIKNLQGAYPEYSKNDEQLDLFEKALE